MCIRCSSDVFRNGITLGGSRVHRQRMDEEVQNGRDSKAEREREEKRGHTVRLEISRLRDH